MLDRARSPLPWLAALLALYLLAPILAFLVRLGRGVSSAPGLGGALATSLLTATISAAVIAALGVPLAYLLAHSRGPLARLALALVSLPLALPPLMSGLLLLYVIGPYTAAGRLFGGGLTESRLGIVLAQTFVAAPFLIIAARAAFAAVDPALEDVARTLGHGRLARFRHVAVPAALPGVGAGLLLAWLRSFGEFGATVILAYHPYSLPVFTFVQFGSTGLPATMLPVAVALAAALAVLLLSGLRAPRRRVRAPRAATISRAPSPPPGSRGLPEVLDFAVRKRLGDFSLELAHRASSPRLALLGASGAGKTLTLRLLAGLTPSEGGHVREGSRRLHALPCERRDIGYVPQSSALVPRRTVWRQVTFGARARPELAAWWLARLGLAGLEDRFPEELSGGQQRRVALARALATEPRVLLLDEPFSGLDAPVRDRLRRDLRRLQRDGGPCTVLVTHDPEDAAMLAEDIVVIDDGRALQAGPRLEVFQAPASAHVAALLGIANARRGRVAGPDTLVSDGVLLHAPTHGLPEGREVVWCVRPERIRLAPPGPDDPPAHAHDAPAHAHDAPAHAHDAPAHPDDAPAHQQGVDQARAYEAVVLDEIDLGAVHELTVALDGKLELTLRATSPSHLELDARLRVLLAPRDIAVWGASAAGTAQPPM
ncbi:MAG TPA: ATP-binding cassette domain-containing protein [Solirubrobacteraceae bacterium]|nr:ATP-binding cassette domain-containing protein [Solirubrobacteraceae bacterium]